MSLPAPQKISGSQIVFQSLGNHSKNGRNSSGPVAHLNFFEVIDIHAKDGKREGVFGKHRELLANMGVY